MENEYYWDDPVEYHDSPAPKRGRIFRAMAMAVAVASIFAVVRTTMAANVDLGGGAVAEFGQGVAMYTSCASSTPLTLTPYSTFKNASGTGSFKLSDIGITDIPSACNGVDFLIQAYDSVTSTAIPLYDTSTTEVIVHINGSTASGIYPAGGFSVVNPTSTSFKATFNNPASISGNAARFTIQSLPFVPKYKVGDIGPGGGVVFVYKPNGFYVNGAFVHYLEVAPTNWYGSTPDPWLVWANPSYQSAATGATETATGTGWVNSAKIIAQGNNASTAAGAADAYVGNGKSDWYLPSIKELNELCKFSFGQATGDDAVLCTNSVGTYNATVPSAYQFSAVKGYYSSTEHDASNARTYVLYQATVTLWASKNNLIAVRPIRAFYN